MSKKCCKINKNINFFFFCIIILNKLKTIYYSIYNQLKEPYGVNLNQKKKRKKKKKKKRKKKKNKKILILKVWLHQVVLQVLLVVLKLQTLLNLEKIRKSNYNIYN